MGGYGSGIRSRQGKKGLTDHRFSIDVRDWHRKGRFLCDQRFTFRWQESSSCLITVNATASSSHVSLSISTSEKSPIEDLIHQSVFLKTTECHFGGTREWFQCPIRECGKRVAILYFSGAFACRECCNLAYHSQEQSASTRASRRANRTRAKLGWEPGFLNGIEWKKKGMHWKTFGRLLEQYEQEAASATLKLAASMGLDIRNPWDR